MQNSTHLLKKIFFFLTLATGCGLALIQMNYQPWLAEGDHGLVLYASEMVLNGHRPYHDFHFFYGPLMPYYFGAFLLLFGVKISSVLMAQSVLNVCTGLCIYGFLSRFTFPALSCLAAIWFWLFSKSFFYTYNHIGIIACSMFAVYLCGSYIKHGRLRTINLALIAAVVAGLIKLNFGIILSLEVAASVFVIDLILGRSLFDSSKRILYAMSLLVVPLLVLLSNYLTVIGLPFHIVKQCFQYFGNDATAEEYPGIFENLNFISTELIQRVAQFDYSIVILVSAIILSIFYFFPYKSKVQPAQQTHKEFLCAIACLAVFTVGNWHEFILSGVYFRTFFSEPMYTTFIFLLLGWAAVRSKLAIRSTVFACLFVIVISQLYFTAQKISIHKKPWKLIPMPKADIYVQNNPRWMHTTLNTVQYIGQQLGSTEKFLAIPYDPLLYYLTDRVSPTRQLVFLQFNQIPEQQEQAIIKDLEQHQVNWITMSNRVLSDDRGEGVFGQTHCLLLNQYIKDNFEVVRTIGEWDKSYKWADQSAIKIWRRR